MAITTSVSRDGTDEAGLVEQRLDEFVTASAEIAPDADRDSQVWGMQFDAGLAWVDFPNDHGGLGVSAALRATVTNRLRAEGIRDSGSANGIGVLLAGPTLVALGSTEQQRRYLRPMFTAKRFGVSCSVNRVQDPTSAPSPPAQPPLATGGWSVARRFGRPSGMSRAGAF